MFEAAFVKSWHVVARLVSEELVRCCTFGFRMVWRVDARLVSEWLDALIQDWIIVIDSMNRVSIETFVSINVVQ